MLEGVAVLSWGGRGLCQRQTAASKPPPPKGTLPPFVIGMTPEIGPPLAAAAGVSSVWFAPAFSGAGVHRKGVTPCTCAEAADAGTSTRATAVMVVPIAKRSVDISVLRKDFKGNLLARYSAPQPAARHKSRGNWLAYNEGHGARQALGGRHQERPADRDGAMRSDSNVRF